ncbi:MAG: alternative ribosome rescue aminoacyl-tRNA hydrolase ArfB [Planctomycetota bacterium]
MAPTGPLRVHSRLTLPADELGVTYARSGGPGGQNVNKVESKVVLRFSVRASRTLSETQRERLLERLPRLTGAGELVIHASRYRDRERNLDDARERLATMLRDALAQRRARKATRPTRASQRRRLDAKRRRSETKRRRKESHD